MRNSKPTENEFRNFSATLEGVTTEVTGRCVAAMTISLKAVRGAVLAEIQGSNASHLHAADCFFFSRYPDTFLHME